MSKCKLSARFYTISSAPNKSIASLLTVVQKDGTLDAETLIQPDKI